MATAADTKRTVMIRNLTRQRYFLNVDDAIAQRARDEAIPGIHMDLPMLVIGDVAKKSDLDADPNITIPAWLWDSVKNYDGPASLKVGEERKPRNRQGAFIQGLIAKNDIVVDVRRA